MNGVTLINQIGPNSLVGPAGYPDGVLQPQGQSAHALARLARYITYRAFYDGEHWTQLPQPGEIRLTFNYCRVFVNKAASYLFGKPVGYEAYALGDLAQGKKGRRRDPGARKVEEYLDRVHDFNNASALDLDTAISSGLLGDGAWTVRWDKEAGLPRITQVDPAGLDCRWRQDDLRTLTWVKQEYYISPIELTPLQLERLQAGKMAPVDMYMPLRAKEEWTAARWALWMDGVEIDGGPNPYEDIPYVIFPNLRVPGEFWGEGDLCDLVGIQQELNARMSTFARILLVAGNPVAVIEGADEEDTATLKLGPNQLWTLPAGAKADVLDLLKAGGAQAHFQYIDTIYRTMHDISEMPRTSFGDSSGQSQARSGVALEIELQPLLHKLGRKQLILSAALTRRAQLVLKIAQVHGVDLPNAMLRVTWPPTLPQDRDAVVKQEVTLVGAGIHPPTTAMEALNEPDPDTLLELVVEENSKLMAAGLRRPLSTGYPGLAAGAGVAGGGGAPGQPATVARRMEQHSPGGTRPGPKGQTSTPTGANGAGGAQ